VESTPGTGSTFTLYVPAAAGTAPAPEPPAANPPVQLRPKGSDCGTRTDDDIRTNTGTGTGTCTGTCRDTDGRGAAAQVLRHKRVLVVDDDIRNVYAMTHLLGRAGMSVRYAENGSEALTALKTGPAVDLVLMDIMMPGLDGYETIRTLRADPRFAALPVVALTAQAMPGDGEQSLSAGASAYVPKPVAVDALLGTVHSLLDPHSSPRPR
jgi:CheY-like chemotaxis protein